MVVATLVRTLRTTLIMTEATGATPSTMADHDCSRNHSAMNDDGRLRADTYSILASLLSAPPTQDLLDCLERIEPSPDAVDSGNIGEAWQQIHRTAAQWDLPSLDDEYHALFIGLGRGEVVPYGSWHLTGFLMEKPLSDLRDDFKSLGIAPNENQKDPEDHIAALCEAMAIIICADDIDETRERQFFMRHIHAWAGKFFQELQTAKSAHFYQTVGLLGQRFVELENQYLAIQTH